MTAALERPIRSGMKVTIGLMTLNAEFQLISIVTGAFVDALSGTGIANTMDLDTGAAQ